MTGREGVWGLTDFTGEKEVTISRETPFHGCGGSRAALLGGRIRSVGVDRLLLTAAVLLVFELSAEAASTPSVPWTPSEPALENQKGACSHSAPSWSCCSQAKEGRRAGHSFSPPLLTCLSHVHPETLAHRPCNRPWGKRRTPREDHRRGGAEKISINNM